MYDLYLKAFEDNLMKFKNEEKNYKDALKSLVFYGVKIVNLKERESYMTQETSEADFDFIQMILGAIAELTPREFMQIFPITKVYDGDRYECKDYFYTRDYIRGYGIDEIIGDGFSFLYEYTNIHTQIFTVKVMGAMDNIRVFEGKASIMEEFMTKQGVSPATIHTDKQGRQFIIKDGKTMRVTERKKRKPKYLKLLK